MVSEYAGAELGDERRTRRLHAIVERLEAAPAQSFPRAMDSEAELEGFYRFIRNEAVTHKELLAPHQRATVERVKAAREVLVVHDTTAFKYGGTREGLGRLNIAGMGFKAHVSLAVSADGERTALGVLAMEPWVRKGPSATALRHQRKVSYAESRRLPREQERWWRAVSAVEHLAGASAALIHVMDSEADDYALMSAMVGAGLRCVIRLCYDRRLAFDEGEKTKSFVAKRKIIAKRAVVLSRHRRPPGGGSRGRVRERNERHAQLGISATNVVWARPQSSPESAKTLSVNIVRVAEIKPPREADPVEWLLITTDPIDTEEQILAIVDRYRSRWLIEEYFQALKTGCAIEKRQLESLDTLLKALALFVPIAWNLLRMRTLSRDEESAKRPARALLSKLELDVLAGASKKPLPTRATIADAIAAIARLGGHIANNGPPGWQVLGRGYQDLLMMCAGYRLAQDGK